MSTIHNTAEIVVGSARFLIDLEDAERVAAHHWCAFDNKRGHCYAQTNVRVDGKKKTLRLHRFLLGANEGFVDHINGNTLDNRKANLRMADRSINAINRVRRHGGPMKTKNGWIVRTQLHGVSTYHGFFLDHTDALRVFESVAPAALRN